MQINKKNVQKDPKGLINNKIIKVLKQYPKKGKQKNKQIN